MIQKSLLYNSSIFFVLFSVPVIQQDTINIKENIPVNEAVLVINGPEFKKDAKYRFLPDIITVGIAEKDNKVTKISFTRPFGETAIEYFTISIDTDLQLEGTAELDPPRDKSTRGHVSIVYRKFSADGTQTSDFTLLSKSGSLTIETYSGQYIKGVFSGAFSKPEGGAVYSASGSFKISRNK